MPRSWEPRGSERGGRGGAPDARGAAVPGETLPARARLRRRGEFLTVQRHGRRVEGACFIAVAARGPGPSRLGVTVSRKVGQAVVRTRIKRVVRETFRTGRALLGGAPFDLVVIARASAAQAPRARLREDLRALLARVGRAR